MRVTTEMYVAGTALNNLSLELGREKHPLDTQAREAADKLNELISALKKEPEA